MKVSAGAKSPFNTHASMDVILDFEVLDTFVKNMHEEEISSSQNNGVRIRKMSDDQGETNRFKKVQRDSPSTQVSEQTLVRI